MRAYIVRLSPPINLNLPSQRQIIARGMVLGGFAIIPKISGTTMRAEVLLSQSVIVLN